MGCNSSKPRDLEIKDVAQIIFSKTLKLNGSYLYSIEMYITDIKNLLLLENKNINDHKGLGPLHFFYVKSDYKIYLEEMIEHQIIDQNFANKVIENQKTSKEILKKFEKLLNSNKLYKYFSEDNDTFFSKNNNINFVNIKKIIFIHYQEE